MRHGPRCSSRAFLTSRFVGTSELVWTGAVGQAPALPIWYATTPELYNTIMIRSFLGWFTYIQHKTWMLQLWTGIEDGSFEDVYTSFLWMTWSQQVGSYRSFCCATVLQFPTISDHLRRFQERGAWQNAIDLLYGFQHTVQEITRDQEVRNCCQTIGACERGRLGGLVVDMYRLQWAWAIKKSLDALNRVVHSVSTYVVAWFGCGYCEVSFRFRIRGKHGMVQIHADTTHSDGNHVQKPRYRYDTYLSISIITNDIWLSKLHQRERETLWICTFHSCPCSSICRQWLHALHLFQEGFAEHPITASSYAASGSLSACVKSYAWPVTLQLLRSLWLKLGRISS